MIRRIIATTAFSSLGFVALLGIPALADATATPAPSVPMPAIPKSIQDSPYGQAASEAIQGYLKRQRDLARNGAHGTVTFYRGYDLQVYTQSAPFLPSHYRDVHLHRGTVINPRGITLQTGMVVDVSGAVQADGSLRADHIDVVQ